MQVEEVTFRSSGTGLEDFEKEFSCHVVMLFMELGCIGWCGWVFFSALILEAMESYLSGESYSWNSNLL